MDAHHIFPKAKEFRAFFEKVGIDVNNPEFLRWVKSGVHRGTNSVAHLNEWRNVIRNFKGRTPTINELLKEAKRIEKLFE